MIVDPGIGYCVAFRYVFTLGEYRYYDNRGQGIGVSLEVAHGNDAVAVLLNGKNSSSLTLSRSVVHIASALSLRLLCLAVSVTLTECPLPRYPIILWPS